MSISTASAARERTTCSRYYLVAKIYIKVEHAEVDHRKLERGIGAKIRMSKAFITRIERHLHVHKDRILRVTLTFQGNSQCNDVKWTLFLSTIIMNRAKKALDSTGMFQNEENYMKENNARGRIRTM